MNTLIPAQILAFDDWACVLLVVSLHSMHLNLKLIIKVEFHTVHTNVYAHVL